MTEGPAGDAAQSQDPQEGTRRSAALERALRESEERFRAAMNNMAEGVFTVDAQGLATYVNPSAERLLGWSNAELVGRKVHNVTHYQHADGSPFPAEECPALQVLQRGIAIREHQDMFIRKDGSFLPVVFSASPLKTKGETVGIVVCFRDDTARRHAEELLEMRISERTRELENATTKLRELSGELLQTQDQERRRIARELHDGVGQLLAALTMNASKLNMEKSKLSPDAQRSLDENAALIQQALQEIRTMSHLLHPPLLDDVGLESALRWFVSGFAERSKIDVRMELAPGFGDELPRDVALSVFRIVQESLTNIHRHSGSPTAEVEIDHLRGQVTVRVKDEGRGFPVEFHSNFFLGGGPGVGLRGMRERVRQLGGQLEVHSGDGGSEIVAVLPAPDELATRNEARSAEEWPKLNSTGAQPATVAVHDLATILCIDDEAPGLLTRKLLLESAGHRVFEAQSGEEGIRIFQTVKVDAVVLDYWMSGMKGTAVASELKRINPNIPIIVLSGMSDLPGEAAGLVDQWLVKGTHRAEHLLDSITTLLNRRAV